MAQPKWVVKEARPRKDYIIDLVFADGTAGSFDARALLGEPFYSPLASLPLFLSGHVECGTVVWGDEVDIAPEILYKAVCESR